MSEQNSLIESRPCILNTTQIAALVRTIDHLKSVIDAYPDRRAALKQVISDYDALTSIFATAFAGSLPKEPIRSSISGLKTVINTTVHMFMQVREDDTRHAEYCDSDGEYKMSMTCCKGYIVGRVTDALSELSIQQAVRGTFGRDDSALAEKLIQAYTSAIAESAMHALAKTAF